MIRLGTRRSPLAQAQTDRVISLLPGTVAEKIVIETEGDKDQRTTLRHLDRPGAFTSLLTDAILDGRLDAAVHSLKDLPLEAPPEAPIVAILPRDDAADVLLHHEDARDATRPLGLKAGSRVGTSAPRRQADLLHADPELIPVDVRGNVGTRLALLERGVIDALLMAAAVFQRMRLPLPPKVLARRLDPRDHPPAPGQGTIAVQARRGSQAAIVLSRLDDAPTRGAVGLERAVLARLGGGCGLPLGAYAQAEGARWRLDAILAPPSWRHQTLVGMSWATARGSDTGALVEEVHRQLTTSPSRAPRPAIKTHVAMTLDADAVESYDEALASHGYQVHAWTLLHEVPTHTPPPMPLSKATWLAFTSPRAVRAIRKHLTDPARLPRIAALGAATARALRSVDLPVHVVSRDATAESLANAIIAFPAPPGAVLLPQSTRALPTLADGLRRAGHVPHAWGCYHVTPIEKPAPFPDGATTLVLTSPSNVEAYQRTPAAPFGTRLVALGPTTQAAMREAGLPVHATLVRRSPFALLEVPP